MSMSTINIEEILEGARWEAEFGEGRASTVAIWIKYKGGQDMVCRFGSIEEAYKFGCAFLLKNCPDYTVGDGSYYTCVIGYNSTVRVEMCVGFTPADAKLVTSEEALAFASAF